MLYLKLLEWFEKNGIRKVHVGRLKLKKDFNPFQWILVNILVKDYGICYEKKNGNVIYNERGFYVLRGVGPEESDATICKNGIRPYLKLPNEPYFVIDLSFYSRHTPKEKKRLLKQVAFSLIEIRKYLWDKHLVLSGVNEEIIKNLVPMIGKNKITFARSTLEFLEEKKLKNIVILDPDAEEELTEEDIKKSEGFLIGGIVDLGINLSGETTRLFREVDAERKVIKLEGSIKGVPDRINRIISILLKVRYLNISLKDAIIQEQTRKDILSRLQIELPKIWIKKGNRFYVKKEDIELLSRKLFGGKDLTKYIKSFKIEVLDLK